MGNSITVSEKKEFIEWFLDHYELQKKGAAFLLRYLSSDEKLLKKVHFVENVRYLWKSLIISTKCSNMPPFRFIKNKRVDSDVETAFFDIKFSPDEDIYIGLYFKDRNTCPEYAAVLEGNPMEKQDLVQDKLLSLFAEILLDQAVLDFQEKQLYKKIDDALATGDREAFLQLSEQWRKMLELKE
ncbi:YpiB family protein [Thermoflavimicrobium dichotomicum]|uniref:Uncharacterized protein YpiB, UPF0302 family n=1 Tax=Thermoflavimicrobium dichotomicum TaxID=46223 RepID=A0A1I3SJH9_9BACL|nr:YpiB family protein [Thermoflavimicrobium dichotomicum]SFJ58803.1 Uncharacterized protein YpiB, UPF0302 family [Thermoflavimicrobium dichotomicum]